MVAEGSEVSASNVSTSRKGLSRSRDKNSFDKNRSSAADRDDIAHLKRRAKIIINKCHQIDQGGCLRGVMVKAMDCGIVVSEFVLQSRYYVHFRTNTLGKVMNPLIPTSMG